MGLKIKTAGLAFSIFVAITGSIITYEEWKQLNPEELIELIQENPKLEAKQRNLLLAMLQSNAGYDEIADLFSRQSTQLRVDASKETNPYRKEQFSNAASFFEQSLNALRRIKSNENSIADLERKIANSTRYTQQLRNSWKRVRTRQLYHLEQEKKQLPNARVRDSWQLDLSKKPVRLTTSEPGFLLKVDDPYRDLEDGHV